MLWFTVRSSATATRSNEFFWRAIPGHFVTGSLYRPVGKSGQSAGGALPARALGQWPILQTGSGSRRKQISEGAERFESADDIRCKPVA